MIALNKEYTKIAKLLIEKGADVNARDGNGKTALMCAIGAFRNDKDKEVFDDIAKFLIIEKGADVNVRTNDGRTALMDAVMYNNYEIAMFLIAKGADVNVRTNDGRTALMDAVYHPNSPLTSYNFYRKASIVKLLIEKGADVNVRYNRYNQGYTVLMKALLWNDTELVKLFIKKGADVNAEAMDGSTPLELAKKWGCSPEIIRLLKQAGARE